MRVIEEMRRTLRNVPDLNTLDPNSSPGRQRSTPRTASGTCLPPLAAGVLQFSLQLIAARFPATVLSALVLVGRIVVFAPPIRVVVVGIAMVWH